MNNEDDLLVRETHTRTQTHIYAYVYVCVRMCVYTYAYTPTTPTHTPTYTQCIHTKTREGEQSMKPSPACSLLAHLGVAPISPDATDCPAPKELRVRGEWASGFSESHLWMWIAQRGHCAVCKGAGAAVVPPVPLIRYLALACAEDSASS